MPIVTNFFIKCQKSLLIALLTAITYYSAINRYHTLPWVIAAFMLATLIVGFVMPRLLLKNLSITRTFQSKSHENQSITLEVSVKNTGWMPAFVVEAVDRLPFIEAALGDKETKDKLLGIISYIPAKFNHHFEVSLKCEKRGLYALGPIKLTSSFPLGLIESSQQRSESIDYLTIYPYVFPIKSLPLFGSPNEIHRGSFLLPKNKGSTEFSGIREYRRGDHPRHIHWLTTARLNQLMVKEFEPIASARIYLALDLSATSNIGKGKHSTAEYSISIAASICGYASENNITTSLYAEGNTQLWVREGVGNYHFQHILEALAVIDVVGKVPYTRILERAASECRFGDTVIVFISQDKNQAIKTLQYIAQMQSEGIGIIAIVFDINSFSSKAIDAVSASVNMSALNVPSITIKNGDDLLRRFNT